MASCVLPDHHRLRGRRLALSMRNGNFRPPQNRHPSTDHQTFVTCDYVGDLYSCIKLGAHQSTWGFWAHGWNITKLWLFILLLKTHLQVTLVDGLSSMMAQTKQTRTRMASSDTFVFTKRRHELYRPTYSKWELLGLFRLQSQTVSV